jgi:transcriptional regulator with XRE-family HTH domain
MTFRGEKGMNAKEMAEALGCSPSCLSQVESGKTPPSAKFLRKCVEYFNLSQDRAFELCTAAYEQQHKVTLDLDEISGRIPIEKESLSKLVSVLTISRLPNLNYHVIAPQYDEIKGLEGAIDKLWNVLFGQFRPSACPAWHDPLVSTVVLTLLLILFGLSCRLKESDNDR